MDVRLPDGTLIRDVPEGTTKADLVQKLQRNGMAVPSEWLAPAPTQPAPQAAQTAGGALRDIPRQLGLTARYGLEGLAQVAEMGTEPIRRMVVNPVLRAVRAGEVQPLTQGVSGMLDAAGLPQPRDANERTIGTAARTVAGAGGMIAGASRAAAAAAPGVGREVLSMLAARPGVQAFGAAGAGAAGGAVRESGGSDAEQFGAALLGGVAAGSAANAATNAVGAGSRMVRSMLTPKTEQVRAADQQITLTLQRAGIDWNAIPERVRQSMREEVAQAMNTGQPLNPDAIRRLTAFRQTGTTPTVGMLTQDPGQITREMNLAKTGANSTDASLQRLPMIQNRNAAQLLNVLDESGAASARSAADVSGGMINALDSRVQAAQGQINQLYSAARDTSGRSLPLEGGTFSTRANQLLDEANVGSFLPPDIAKKMNAIARGEYPLTVDVAEQLKTSIGNLQRGSNDGNMRRALGIVRQALDEAPLQGSAPVNPGNLPAVPGTVPPSTAVGQESIDAFNAARRANRAFMQRVEENPALRAVVDGVEPDQFLQRYLVGNQATAADVRRLRSELTPESVTEVRNYITRYLRDAATNNTDDITKFSQDAYRKALRNLGDNKLSVFFEPAEIQQLRAVGDAAKYMQAQPTGSAVNNSNSGALMLGRGLDMLSGVSSKLPLGLKDTITGTVQGMQQTQVLRPQNALSLAGPPRQNALRLNPLLAGSVVTPVQSAEDKRRN